MCLLQHYAKGLKTGIFYILHYVMYFCVHCTCLYCSELGRIRALSTEQTNELQAQLMKVKGVKNKLERELEKSDKALKG